jgi:hypothetical protein
MKNLFRKITALAALGLLVASPAFAITLDYTAVGVGSFSPASQANNDSDVEDAANILVNWYNGGSAPGVVDGVTYVLAGTSLGALPSPVDFGSKDELAPFTSVDTDAWEYVLGKYGNVAYLFYVGDLSGIYDLPGTLGGNGLSHEVFFNASTRQVPDGGATVVLLGLGLVGMSFIARRRLAA